MIKIFTKLSVKTMILITFIAAAQLYAANKTWNGSVSTDWNTAANWTNSGVPASGDDVTIPTSPTGGRMPIISSGTFGTKKLTIQSGATLTQNGGTLTPTDIISITGSFIQNTGSFSTNKVVTVFTGGSCSFNGSFSGVDFNVSSGAAVSVSGTFTTNDEQITIDGGTFTQSGGTVTTKDMQLSNGGTYNQTGGEFQISHDLKVPVGTTFNGTGGTVRFTGSAGAAANYKGTVQVHNLIVDIGGNYKLENGDVIKISGNYTNNSTTLDNDKGTLIFNGTSPQTIYSASSPASTRTIAGNVVIANSPVTLTSNVGIHSSLSFQSGGHVDLNGYNIYLNGTLYNGPTPVEIVSFNARVKNVAVTLEWRTATEVNNYGFEIERSLDNKVWTKIGFVAGHGNSNSPKDYYFEDIKLANAIYFYRLKQIDADGKFDYSKSVSVSFNQLPKVLGLSQNYPNPFNPSTRIKYDLAEENFVTIKVFNAIGNEIATLVNDKLSAGSHELNFDGSQLSSGVYIYRIQAGNFSDTKKMILSK